MISRISLATCAVLVCLTVSDRPSEAVSAPAAQALDPNLLAHWRFDEAPASVPGVTNIAVDDTGTNDGTYMSDASTAVDVPAAISSWSTSSLYCLEDSLSDPEGVTATLSANSLAITGPMTISVWVKPLADPFPPTTGTTQYDILSKFFWNGSAGEMGYLFRLSGEPPCYAKFSIFDDVPGGVTAETWTSSTYLQANLWYHVVGVYDGSDIYVYVDHTLGGAAAAGPVAAAPPTVGTTIPGIATATPHVFNGYLDDLRVYNRVLTDQEIADLALGIDLQPTVTPPPPTPTPGASGIKEGEEECGCGSVSTLHGTGLLWLVALAALGLVFPRKPV